MSESEIRRVNDLEKDVAYIVKQTLFNATVLHPLPHLPEAKPYMRDMGNIHLEEGWSLTYNGTAGELGLYGDLNSESPIFKPGEEIKKQFGFIAERDVLAINPFAVVRLTKKND